LIVAPLSVKLGLLFSMEGLCIHSCTALSGLNGFLSFRGDRIIHDHLSDSHRITDWIIWRSTSCEFIVTDRSLVIGSLDFSPLQRILGSADLPQGLIDHPFIVCSASLATSREPRALNTYDLSVLLKPLILLFLCLF
jgi:hypothetical protein